GMLVHQHLKGGAAADQLMAEDLIISPGQEPGAGKHDDQVTHERSDLAAAHLGDGDREVIEIRLMGILPHIERTCHRAGRERRLLRREGGMRLFDKDKAKTVVDAVDKAMPEDSHW